MSQPIISVRNISKRYQLGETIRHDTLRDRLADTAGRLLGRKKTRPVADAQEANEFWALKDVSFDIQPGEVVGIIGRNGAGKSTLLKILSQITEPTDGEIRIRGRIASLLEVGTGFHPELTGRENVFLNGAILGMTQAEIRRKFDEIVAFAEIEKFLDTPVKRYSSGMYVRLAFAVAAHLDPEILIVDEVLAVGDAAFQKKCLGKMEKIGNSGRTVLFVSHNLGVVANLCSKGVYLRKGQLVSAGPTSSIVEQYVKENSQAPGSRTWPADNRETNNGRVHLQAARILCNGEVTGEVTIDDPVVLQIDFGVLQPSLNVCSSIHVYDKHGVCAFVSGTKTLPHKAGTHRHEVEFPPNLFNDGRYTCTLILLTETTRWEVFQRDAISFNVNETGTGREEYGGNMMGCVRPMLAWNMRQLT